MLQKTAGAAVKCLSPGATMSGSLIEGVIDLAFEQADGWTVIDFKTDEEFLGNELAYRRQVAMYASGIRAANGGRVSALLMRV